MSTLVSVLVVSVIFGSTRTHVSGAEAGGEIVFGDVNREDVGEQHVVEHLVLLVLELVFAHLPLVQIVQAEVFLYL